MIRKITTAFKRRIGIASIALLATCLSCNHKKENAVVYFAIDSLVREQAAFLSASHLKLSKQVVMGKLVDTLSISKPDATFWLKELDAFLQLDEMNKPSSRAQYQVEKGLQDTQSNLKVKLFTGEPAQKIRWLKLYYHQSLEDLRKMEALLVEKNRLYKSSRLLKMEFQKFNNKTLLTSYSVSGGQKMLMKDSVDFSINGRISIH